MAKQPGITLQAAMPEIQTRTGMFLKDAVSRAGNGLLAPPRGKETFSSAQRKKIVSSLEKDLNGPSFYQALQWAPYIRRDGNLELANVLYTVDFLTQNPYDKENVWEWAKVMLLAKNFEDAWTLLLYLYSFNACYNRLSVKAGDMDVINRYRMWGTEPPLDPNGFNAMQYLQNVSDGRKWDTPQQVKDNIVAYGAGDYWKANFKLGSRDFKAFAKWFHR